MPLKITVRKYWRYIVVSLALLALASVPAYAISSKQEHMQVQGQGQGQQVVAGQSGQPAAPLERVLNKDGTLNLSTGFSGSVSLDPKGWRMQTEPNGQLRFVKSDEQHQQQHPIGNPRSATSLFTPLAPGDENWDDRFDTSGVSGTAVYDLAISGTEAYVGGDFSAAGGVPVNSIAKWDGLGGQWSALGSGVDGLVLAIAITGTDVYVGGYFAAAGGVGTSEIARWDGLGGQWSALGSGVYGHDDQVFAIGISGNDVYVGGRFTTAGGVPVNNIARWNTTTSSWSALGSGVSGTVYGIASNGSDVYVGGVFATAGGVPVNNIARWNTTTSSWSALGSGVSGGSPNTAINAIAISDNDVYMGGRFTTAGGVSAKNIAKWNGSSWSALGSGLVTVNRGVNSIAISGSDVYASGSFTTAGGVPVNNIAKWNGSSWSALGSGVTGRYGVNAIAISGSDVYVGGSFTTAGGNASNNFGIWHIPPAANLVSHVSWAGSTQPDTRQMQQLTLTLCSTSGGPTSTYIANTNASGYFTVDVASLITVTAGTYNWWEKGSRSLANGGTLTLTGGNQQEEMGVQRGGDADNDNVVGVLDFQVLRITFNSTTDLRADFNNDGVVSSQDFAILKGSFGQAGAPVACP